MTSSTACQGLFFLMVMFKTDNRVGVSVKLGTRVKLTITENN